AASASAVTINWKPPFYRVRLGPFATRQQAEAVLQAARSVFPDAFVAPKRITNR
ncbi:MAG: SPOR domain-containing protein, partial [Bacteroidetes bacterium QH_6_63_17]